MTDARVKELESRIDADYAGCFPIDAGWEKTAAHLLLAYDFTVRGQSVAFLDNRKYALMHALRWGKQAPSSAFSGYTVDFEPPLFEACRVLLTRGAEYVGICGGFISYYRNLARADRVEERLIEFSANPSWKAYDVLAERHRFQQQATSPELRTAVQRIAMTLAGQFTSLQPPDALHWFPDFATARTLLSPVNNVLQTSFTLPPSSQFDGISIRQLRDFWRAVVILGLIQCAIAYRLTGPENTSLGQLLIKPRDALANWIAGCVGLNEQVALRALNFHIYDRQHQIPDIAVTPFVPLNDHVVAASPWMLISSAFERNLRAHIARQQPRSYDTVSDGLAPHIATELVARFEGAGFRATHSLPFKTDDEQGDIDLLVWSPSEHYVLAAELKWIIDVADFMEVLNRGEKTCQTAIKEQLPKYARLMTRNVEGLVAKAFTLDSPPRIDGWSCGIIVRGFVGSPTLSVEPYLLLPDLLLEAKLRPGTSLRDFCKWAMDKLYLPREGYDFRMYPVEVITPSGLHVTFWEWEEINRDA